MLSDNIVFATRGKNKKEKLSVSRQTVSKWEMDKRMDAYSNLRVEEVEGFSYVEHAVLPVGIQPEGLEIKVQPKHRYAAVHVEKPFENPFVTIPSAYQALDSFMRVNGLVHTESGVIPCYETNGESMDIYIACE